MNERAPSKERDTYDVVANVIAAYQGDNDELARRIVDSLTAEDLLSAAHEPPAEPSSEELKRKLAAAGVFKGFEGLEGLLNSQPFWDEQSYGTRIYYGPGITEYLHRDVLRQAVEILKTPPASAPPPRNEYPEELFDGRAVEKELTEQAKRRTSAENVIDVLDAVVRLIRKRLSLTKGERL